MILNKRIFRELKENWVRYGALFLLIVIGVMLVVSMAGGADSVIHTVHKYNKINNIEDGTFSLYIKLPEEAKNDLEKIGATIEETFYFDVPMENNSTLRIFKNRENINKVHINNGDSGQEENEIVLEQHYAKDHKIGILDTLSIEKTDFKVTGIGSAPDYNMIMASVSDVASETEKFSIAFVSDEAFKKLVEISDLHVEYSYSYVLNDKITHQDIKEYLMDMTFDTDLITDAYYQGIIGEIESKKNEMTDGTQALVKASEDIEAGSSRLKSELTNLRDGNASLSSATKKLLDGGAQLHDGANSIHSASGELNQGLRTISKQNAVLISASENIFKEFLAMAQVELNDAFSPSGIEIPQLSKDNYPQVLENIMSAIGENSEGYLYIASLKGQLDNYNAFYEGLRSYTSAVSSAEQGTTSLYEGTKQMAIGTGNFKDRLSSLYDGSVKLSNGSQELVKGASKLDDGTYALKNGTKDLQDGVQEYLDESMNVDYIALSYFLPSDQNPRITSYEDDSAINKIAALVVGVVFVILIAYILSVFVVHDINAQGEVIGALYSMGYIKKELLRHFMILPIGVTACGGMIGTVLGLLRMKTACGESEAYYSFPSVETVFPLYLLLYGIVLPILIALVVNWVVIHGKLSLSPIQLLRREKKQSKYANVDLKNMGFINRYRIRQIVREMRGNITLFFGLFLAIFLLLFGFCIHGSITYYTSHIANDLQFQNMYALKGPLDEIPKGGEPIYVEGLYSYYDLSKSDFEVSLQGIEKENPYFDFQVKGNKNEVYISDSAATKYGWKIGDKIILTDTIEDMDYAFSVAGIVPYASGLSVFMNIDHMRDLFDREQDYYNVILSDIELPIDNTMLISITTVDDIVQSANVFMDLMQSMIVTIVSVSILLFVIVMYLLLKMMIDRATFSISLLKIFGYNDQEINKLYLGSSFYTVLISTAFSIPVSKLLMNKIYPFLISNVSAGMKTYLAPQIYVIIVGIIVVNYLIVNFFLGRHVKKISLAEILKDRA